MKRVALLVLCLLILNCGSSAVPGSPTTSSTLPLQPGRQFLTVFGYSESENPLYPPCVPSGVPYDGPNVDTYVTLERDGADWVARSPARELGSLELRFRESAPDGLRVTGTIRGIGVDAGATPIGIVHDVRMSLAGANGGAAAVEGELASPVSQLVTGRIAGVLRFSDSQGNASTCSAIVWSLQPDRRP